MLNVQVRLSTSKTTKRLNYILYQIVNDLHDEGEQWQIQDLLGCPANIYTHIYI